MKPDENLLMHGAVDKIEDFQKPDAWNHSEIAGVFQSAKWVEKDLKTGFLTYPKRNQGKQMSCVLYTAAKQLAVDELSENGIYRELSPHSVYPYVALPNGGGSSSIEAMKLIVKQGMTLEHLFPTDGLTEADVIKDIGYGRDAKIVAQVYKPSSFVQCAVDFETIASILDGYKSQGIKKVIGVTIVGQNNLTWYSNFPKVTSSGNGIGVWYHRIAITDFGLIGGKKVLAFDNSWGTAAGNGGQQFLTEDWQGKDLYYGGIYTFNLDDDWQSKNVLITPPTYQWLVDLTLGSQGNDVLMLQRALQSMGMFPISKVVAPTGAFFGVTQNGVKLFQAAFGLEQTGIVDAATRAKLNEIFKG